MDRAKNRTTLPLAKNLRMFIIPVLLIVIYLHQGNSFVMSVPIGEVVPSYSKVIEGSNLTLNCTLKSYAVTPLNSSALYFVAVYMNVPQVIDPAFYHILTRQTLQLVLTNVRREDGETFKCYMNDSDLTNKSDTPIGIADVDIGRPPNPIVNVSVVSENFDNMIVGWCPTVSQLDPVDSNLTWAIDNDVYSGNCSVWKITGGYHCACIFCGSTSLTCPGDIKQNFYKFQTYNITITSFNYYGSTTTSLQVYTDSAIVKPGPVINITATPLSSHSLQASWKFPADPSVLALKYEINIFSEWGLNSTIDAGPNTSWLITDLTPSTSYAVAVRCKPPEGGYWSDDSVTSAKTMEDVPAVAPESPVGFFRTSICSEKDDCPVTIFWKLINASLQNGVIRGYQLTVESTLCTTTSCNISVNGGNTTSADIRLSDGVSSWVRLVACTSVGESPPHYIFFPPYFKSLPSVDVQGLYAEYTTEDRLEIFFSWNYIDTVDNYTLMYCAGKQTDKTHCMSSPVSATLPQHQTNFTMSHGNTDHVYALSANYRNGTSGLTPNWICIYDYSGLPAMPDLKSTAQVSDTSIKVVWSPLICTTDNNRVRVLNYTLSYMNNSTLEGASVTLPGNVTEYTITDLTPEVEYMLILRGVSRSGPGQVATAPIITDPAKPVSIVVPVAVAVAVAVVVIIVIIGVVYACRKSHKWFNSVAITPPEKYENKDTVTETVCSNNNYAALSDSGNNLHTCVDLSVATSASVMLDCDSPMPSCQNSLHDVLMIQNESAHLEEELLVSSSIQNDSHPTTTVHSESIDSISSNKTTSTSCESDQSIQTYTTAVANPGTSPESPSFHCPLISHLPPVGDHLPDHDDISLQLQPSIEESTQDLSDSYGYSQARRCNKLDSSVDSSSSCDDYKSVRFKEGSFDEPIGEPIAPQLA